MITTDYSMIYLSFYQPPPSSITIPIADLSNNIIGNSAHSSPNVPSNTRFDAVGNAPNAPGNDRTSNNNANSNAINRKPETLPKGCMS